MRPGWLGGAAWTWRGSGRCGTGAWLAGRCGLGVTWEWQREWEMRRLDVA